MFKVRAGSTTCKIRDTACGARPRASKLIVDNKAREVSYTMSPTKQVHTSYKVVVVLVVVVVVVVSSK